MKTFKVTCEMGHGEAPFTKTVQANSMEEAAGMLMAMPDMMEHVKTSHPDLAGKSPEDMKSMVMSMMTEVAA